MNRDMPLLNFISFDTSGPDDSLFLRFKQAFNTLNHMNLRLWEWPEDLQSPLAIKASAVLQWAEHECEFATFPSEDYQELCELLIACYRRTGTFLLDI